MNPKGRVIFVGIHNKPGMAPLDSRTKSGKIIDEVIKGLEGIEPWLILKTNLFDLSYMPKGETTRIEYARHWKHRLLPTTKDTVILLGQTVQVYFPTCMVGNRVYTEHPASRHIKRDQYIKDLISKILNNG